MSARSVLAALLFLASIHLFAADLRPEIVVNGRVNGVSLSPAGTLWTCTAMGNAFRSDDGGRSWAEADVGSRRPDPREGGNSDILDRLTFFDARRAMLSGYIGEATDQVFVTDDGGATWKSVRMADGSMWVYDASALSDGHGWLVGSDGDVLRTDDYGRTWSAVARPFEHDQERTMSVHFASPFVGVVGSMFSGDVALTNDGGETWTAFEVKGRDEVLRGCGEERDKRVTKVRMGRGRVIVTQCGGVFAAPVAKPRAWSRLTAGAKPLVEFDLGEGDRIIGVTGDGDVHELAPDGTSRALGMRLQHPVLSVTTSGKRIALIDTTYKVAAFDDTSWFTSRMLGKGVAATWPIGSLDRGADDLLWGASEYFLYRSDDGAKTWERIAELPAAADRVLIQGDGDVLLADGHGWVGRWETAAARLVDVPVLNGLDVNGAFRRADLWLVYGGRQSDTAGRVEVAQTFFSGQFAGSADYGFVAASTDGGRSWTIIDRWKEEGPQALFLSDDNRLTLLSWLCGIRQGTVTLKPLGAKMQTVFPGSDRERTPYVQAAMVLDLLGGKDGWIVGWIHHLGNRVYRTADGGRSWKEGSASAYPMEHLYRLFDGTWIGYAQPSTLHRWTGTKFERLTTVPKDVNWAWVDSRGQLSLRSEDGSVRVLEPQRGTLRGVRK